MKFNLKNRPNLLPKGKQLDYPAPSIFYIKKYEEWFEGFEKELQQIRDEIRRRAIDNAWNPTYTYFIIQLIEEILGEEEKRR